MRECRVCKQCYPDAVTTCPQCNQLTFQSIEGNPILEGKYRLERRLGAGGMGVVYCARHIYLKTQLAIKVILPDLVGNDPQLVTRFRQEALAAAAIRHHNVVQVTDYGVVNEKMPFLVMEYVEGESLHDLLAREKRLEPEKAVDLMSAICAGVGAAHKQGIVHRDLKPLNIMLVKGAQSLAESIKILDFGLAKIKSGELLGSFVQAQTTGLMGSPYYMAPEQWADDEPEAQADVYSLGVMLYQMLAGDVPFKGASIPAIMQKHLNQPPPAFSEMGVQVPPMMEQAIRHALTKDPKQRTPGVQQFVTELRRSLGLNTQPLTSGTLEDFMPLSSVHILTNPPQANVFMNNVSVGESQPDGYLLLEGIRSGNHHLKISKDGFQDWENQIVCDGKPQQIVAHLKLLSAGVDPNKTVPVGQFTPIQTQGMQSGFQDTGQAGQPSQIGVQPNWGQTGQQNAVQTIATTTGTTGGSSLIWIFTGIFGLLLLTSIGLGGAYLAGFFGTKTPRDTPQTPGSGGTEKPLPTIDKNEMVQISGGIFKMGNNKGTDLEKPEHTVEVKSFWMDKTEVTNAEYYQFVSETKYGFTPAHWVNEKPKSGDENMPVRNVNMEDVKAFIEWRSKRDNLKYRLPSESEWEFAARNGTKATLYPWGNENKEHCAVVGKSSADVEPVGTRTCGANELGIVDLIGNVWEWTSSEAKAYPGAPGELRNQSGEQIFMIRGGSVFRDAKGKLSETATYRVSVPSKSRDNRLGFRLVRDAS